MIGSDEILIVIWKAALEASKYAPLIITLVVRLFVERSAISSTLVHHDHHAYGQAMGVQLMNSF
jgi:hypothetical protein